MLGLGASINRLSAAEAAAIAGRFPGFTGLLDESYGSGAAAAYSVRKLTNRVSVAMTIRRDSDSTETDIGFDSNGNLDESAITAFCTGTTCRVASWKDQSGNDNHAVQTTAANQPTIYTGGAIVKVDGRPAFTVDGSNDNFNITALTGGQYGIFTVGKPTSLVGYYTDSTTGSRQYILRNNTNYTINGSFNIYNSGTQTTQLFNNQKELVSFLSNSTTSNYIDKLLSRFSVSQSYAGDFSEFIIYTSDKSTDRTSIESNIGDYFTQNTPLLDTYTGAEAAFSLRKLSSDYSGAAIRVRRDNDNLETDINFNVFGELDTVSLAAHCGSNNGYVTNWYDQSSNSNTARQTTAGNQPKIYDATTGVLTENGKPIINLVSGSSSTLLLSTQLRSATQHIFGVAELDSTSNKVMIGVSNGGGLYIANNGDTLNAGAGSSLFINGSSSSITTRDEFSDQFQSQTLFSSIQDLSSGSYNQTRMGLLNGAGESYKMFNMQEIIFYNSDQTTNRSNIEDNINTFYSIY